jgi:hypothetical protein
MTKTCSVILPTRGRPQGVLALIRSLNETTSDLERLEMIVKVDNDDATAAAGDEAWHREAKFRLTVFSDERLHGYCSLNVFVNRMAKMAEGRWLWMLNDDVTVVTQGWDDILRAIPETRQARMGVLRCSYPYPPPRSDYNPNNIFPVVSRELTQLIGHYSLTMYNDSYIDTLGEQAGTILMHGLNHRTMELPPKEKEIVVSHQMVYDHVRKESEAQYAWVISPEEQVKLDADIAEALRKIKEFLNEPCLT